MTRYQCLSCGVEGLDVELAYEVRGNCPNCGDPLVESLRACCVPDCGRAVPVRDPIPVCHDCGIKIAMVYRHDAAFLDAEAQERRRRRQQRQELQEAQRQAASVVYYVRLDENRIKIGYTSRLASRLRSFRVHPSALLAVEPGGRDLEQRRHAQFAHERLGPRVEEFRPTDRLLQWIKDVRAEHDVPHWAKVPDTSITIRRKA